MIFVVEENCVIFAGGKGDYDAKTFDVFLSIYSLSGVIPLIFRSSRHYFLHQRIKSPSKSF